MVRVVSTLLRKTGSSPSSQTVRPGGTSTVLPVSLLTVTELIRPAATGVPRWSVNEAVTG